jgi:acetyl-CoA hydrolase
MRGLHDITMTQLPPHRKPYLIMAPEDRIGTTYIPVDTEKIVAIIESDYQDQTVANSPADETSQAIARHLIEFLEHAQEPPSPSKWYWKYCKCCYWRTCRIQV